MSKSDKKKEDKSLSKNKDEVQNSAKDKKELVKDNFKKSEEKLLRTLAEMENQRRRFEKEVQDAYEFGGFNFAKESLSLLDNVERAIDSFKNDEKLKNSENINKIIDGIEIVKKNLISIFKKNKLKLLKV